MGEYRGLAADLGARGKRGAMRKGLFRAGVGVLCFLSLCGAGHPQQKSKLRGYITDPARDNTIRILDDVITYSSGTDFEMEGGGSFSAQDLEVGLLIEAEGTWSAKHQFTAQKIKCDRDSFDKVIRESVFLSEDPPTAQAADGTEPFRLRADGEILLIGAAGRRSLPTASAGGDSPYIGRRVKYTGTRTAKGEMEVRDTEFGPPPPADAFEIPGDLKVTEGTDPQTGIAVLEFRKGNKVQGRMKLFPVKKVQQYVKSLGAQIIPPGGLKKPFPPLEFRFFVIESEEVNASALPDGTILVNTALLALMDNEAQLAFVLSHEIAHVMQAHVWRQIHETRTKRVLITIAAIAGSGYIGSLATFLGQIGIAAVVNGYTRKLENQADRLAVQNLLDLGYNPQEALRFFRVMTDRYGFRSTSAIWSNHDSMLLRGSFLTVQLRRRFPDADYARARVDTEDFRAMRAAMGPVKIQ